MATTERRGIIGIMNKRCNQRGKNQGNKMNDKVEMWITGSTGG